MADMVGFKLEWIESSFVSCETAERRVGCMKVSENFDRVCARGVAWVFPGCGSVDGDVMVADMAEF